MTVKFPSFASVGPQAEVNRPDLEKAAEKFGIVEPLDQVHWLAQMAHESLIFARMTENLNYSAEALYDLFRKYFPDMETAKAYARQKEKIANRMYANRMGNRDEASGDGWKYRGRWWIQRTGMSNYAASSMGVFGDLRLVTEPEKFETRDVAAMVSAHYWVENGLKKWSMKNDLAAVSGVVNAGSPIRKAHGMEGRRAMRDKFGALLRV